MDEELQQAVEIIRDSLDAHDAALDKLGSRVKRDEIAIGAIGLLAGLGMFGAWQTMKAIKSMAENMNVIGQAVYQIQQGTPQQQNYVPPDPEPTPSNGNVAPPANAPTQNASEAVKKAIEEDPLVPADIMHEDVTDE